MHKECVYVVTRYRYVASTNSLVVRHAVVTKRKNIVVDGRFVLAFLKSVAKRLVMLASCPCGGRDAIGVMQWSMVRN
jgi:hypothetical protein